MRWQQRESLWNGSAILRTDRHRRKRNATTCVVSQPMQLATTIVCFLFLLLPVVCNAVSKSTNASHPPDFLDESSTVLITGAAGFIGSELAMALHRVYNPKKIIAIDSMDDGFGQPEERSDADLGLFEFKRQRVFHLLQTLGPRCEFYRVDFRPNIPDYHDRGEVPVLDSIFSSHPDITHVVHLADPYGSPSLILEGAQSEPALNMQAVPRKKEQIKAGMMEALLEQLYKAGKLHPEGRIPHFTYASSSHVYDHYDLRESSPNSPPFSEEKPITSPSSLHGASKLLDELLARTYAETHNIHSVGLRFFDVYGPWASPGSLLSDMAERAVAGNSVLTEAETRILDDVTRDFIYIDDAVDAILAAMQFRPLASPDKTAVSVVVNVGTGQGTTLRTATQHMQKLLKTTFATLPPASNGDGRKVKPSISIASTIRAKKILGFRPRISLEWGLFQLLTWHYDRAHPYGSSAISDASPLHPLESQGIVACSPHDTECLKGIPVFPCASECSHKYQCTPSYYDSIVDTTRQWTADCEVVLYTVDLDNDLETIPSATAVVSTTSRSHVESKDGTHCNLAFVSSFSPLIQRLQKQSPETNDVLKHGFWTLVLVDSKRSRKDSFLEFLPKLSPGRFFGSGKAKRVIYCDPDVIVDDIPGLLTEAAMQPLFQRKAEENSDNSKENNGEPDNNKNGNEEPSNKENREGATAMLIGKGRHSQSSRIGHTPLQEAVQNAAYRTVRISILDHMTGDGFAQPLDSSFIVHTLKSEDSRLFRCDVFGELIQWGVETDQSAFEFIIELHDMWSSVVAKKAGLEPWWTGEKVITIPEKGLSSKAGFTMKRRLLEEQAAKSPDGNKDQFLQGDTSEEANNNGHNVALAGAVAANNRVQLVKVQGEDPESAPDRIAGRRKTLKEGPRHVSDADVGRARSLSGENGGAAVVKKVDANFGGDDHNPTEHGEVDNAEVVAPQDKGDADDNALDDDSTEQEDADIPSRPDVEAQQNKDVSSYDTWMGILSASKLQYFVRIVPSSEAGVVVLNEH